MLSRIGMVTDATMPDPDFTRLPDPDPAVFTAPLKRPDHIGKDWIEPAQRSYGSDENAVWDAKKPDERLDNFSTDIDILDAFEYSWEPFIPKLCPDMKER